MKSNIQTYSAWQGLQQRTLYRHLHSKMKREPTAMRIQPVARIAPVKWYIVVSHPASSDGAADGISPIPVSLIVFATVFTALGRSRPMFFLMALLKMGKMPMVPTSSQTPMTPMKVQSYIILTPHLQSRPPEELSQHCPRPSQHLVRNILPDSPSSIRAPPTMCHQGTADLQAFFFPSGREGSSPRLVTPTIIMVSAMAAMTTPLKT